MKARHPPAAKSPPSVDDAIEAIRAYVRFRDWSLYELSNACGLALTSIRNLHDPGWSPKSETLRVLHAILPSDFDPALAPSPEEWQRRRVKRKIPHRRHNGVSNNGPIEEVPARDRRQRHPRALS